MKGGVARHAAQKAPAAATPPSFTTASVTAAPPSAAVSPGYRGMFSGHCMTVDSFTQTEATHHYTAAAPSDTFDTTHVGEFVTLHALKDQLKADLSQLAGAIYDMTAVKDTVLKLSHQLPDAPLHDILLVSSRLFRYGSQVSRGIGAFFRIVFSEDFVDEDLHFTELRHVKKALREVSRTLVAVRKERDDLIKENESLLDVAARHESVVTTLSERNQDLEQRRHTLEDQMAVLFQQIARDFVTLDVRTAAQIDSDIEVQAHLGAARSQFLQSVDAVQARLRFFSTLLRELESEIQPTSGAADPATATKSKLKALDVHASQLLNRFTAVREGLQETASQLSRTLLEKKKVLALSLEHIKLYDVLNQRMRNARNILYDLRQSVSEAERTLSLTFAPGSVVKVDKAGDIHITAADASGSKTKVGSGAPALPSRFVAKNVSSIVSLLQKVQDEAAVLTSAVNTDEEHRTLLRAVSEMVPQQNSSAGTTQMASAALPAITGDGRGDVDASSKEAAAEERITEIRNDFAVKVSFLREVYEERIEELEAKLERLQRRANNSTSQAPPVAFAPMPTAASTVDGGGGFAPSSQPDAIQQPFAVPVADAKDVALSAQAAWSSAKETRSDADKESANQALLRVMQLEAQSADASGSASKDPSPAMRSAKHAQVLTENASASPEGHSGPNTPASGSLPHRPSHDDQAIKAPHVLRWPYVSPLALLARQQVATASPPPQVPFSGSHRPIAAAPRTAAAKAQRQKAIDALRTIKQLQLAGGV